MNSDRTSEENNMAEAHNCLRALQAYIGFQQTRISNLENDFRNVKISWTKKEKLLLDRLTSLSKQLQEQDSPRIRKPNFFLDDPNLLLISVALKRIDGSLGFTLNGGGGENIECEGGLSVSKIVSGGAAEGKLQPEDNIIKVNGQDLSKVSHEEAVEAFRVAQEPIVVEVLRRASKDPSPPPPLSAMSPPSPCSSSGGKSSTCPSLADASTQTEWVEGWDELLRPTTPPPGLYSLNNGATEELDDVTPPDPEDSFDDLRHFDFEYEEVTLERASSEEPLGLTLCYGSGEDVETAIFISEIDPRGVAAVDGRIREGDQLLQVNGVDVRTRNEAISMLSSNDKARVTLLLARAQLQDFEVELVDPVTGLQVHQEEDEMGISDDDDGTGHKIADGPPTTDSEGSLDKEVALLSEEMTSLQLPDDGREERWTDDQHQTQEKDSSSAYNTGGESCRSTPLEILTIQPPPPPSNPQLNSSSTQSSQTRNIHATVDAETQLTVDSDAYSVLSCENCRKCLRLPPPPPIRTNGSKMAEKVSGGSSSGRSSKRLTRDGGSLSDLEKNRNYVTLIPRETVYTTEAHLAHTMWLQQEMLRHSLQRQMRGSTGHVNANDGCSPYRQRSSTSNEEMEWKVKKRPDGTRYIARRPVRNKLLKERESKLLQERTLTTDDETVSEVKFGRYWSKEERKRHLERARDQKRKREMILRMRKGSDIVAEEANTSKVTPPHILELSQRKMARKKGKSLFDDFTTVQEVLAHGTRGAGPSKALGLLSVTTV